jgi:aspartate 1-decarboxylase
MKSKVHRATGTRGVDDFAGSCGIAPESMRAIGRVPRVNANDGVAEQAAIA